MSNVIASINGVDVYSDKQVTDIVNTRINFSDGSWCDVSTGKVVNKGHGYISIGEPNYADAEQDQIGPTAYKAKKLNIEGLSADVDIRPISGSDMIVVVKGSKSAIGDMNVSLNGDTLNIKSFDVGRSSSIGHVSCSNISINGNSISIGGDASGTIISGNKTVIMHGSQIDVKINIGVPVGSAIIISNIQGNVVIGDINGSLQAHVKGNGNIRAGEVRDAILGIQGGGDINVGCVTGNLSMFIQGNGDIDVKKGFVKQLTANVQGNGDISFHGQAIDASVTIMGNGDINIALVKNRPMKSIMGNGDITIGNW